MGYGRSEGESVAMIKFRLHKVAADRDITKMKDMAEKAGVTPLTVSGIWNNTSLQKCTQLLQAGQKS